MRTKREYTVPLQFPVRGLWLDGSLEDQPPLTSPDLQNVRAYEMAEGRSRGGQRPGHSKFLPDTHASTTLPIQNISQLRLSSTGTGATGDTLITDSAISLVDTSGTKTATTGEETATVMDASVWDLDGSVFVMAKKSVSTTRGYFLYKINTESEVHDTIEFLDNIPNDNDYGCKGMAISRNILYVYVVDPADATNGLIFRFDPNDIESGPLDGTDTEYIDISTISANHEIHPFRDPKTDAIAQNGELSVMETRIAAITRETNADELHVSLFDVEDGSFVENVTLISGVAAGDVPGVTTDGRGHFYAWGTDSNTDCTVKKFRYNNTSATSGTWTVTDNTVGAGSIQCVSYDPDNNRLFAVGANVRNTGHSFAVLAVSNGAASSNQDLGSVTEWHWCGADGAGGLRVTRFGSGGNNVGSYTEAFAQTFLSTLGDDDQTGNSVNAGYGGYYNNSIKVVNLAVSNGTVKRFNRTSFYPPSAGGGQAVSFFPHQIYSTEHRGKIYFVDGLDYKEYDGDADIVQDWTISTGTQPVSGQNTARLICTWRDRVVLSGVVGDRHNWFMCKGGAADNWNYDPANPTEIDAVAGDNSDAGKLEDVINSLVPYNDDILIMGGEHSIWRMAGDPLQGGRLDRVSDITGMLFGNAWTKSPSGMLYFVGSRGGIYRMAPGGQPQRITANSIEEELQSMNFRDILTSMAWDDRQVGFHVYFTPYDGSTGTHYFYDARNEAWWRDVFATDAHQPFCTFVYDADDPEDRKVLLGCQDGKIRFIDYAADDDDGSAINSYCFIGPIRGRNRMQRLMLKELQCTLDSTSNDVTATIHQGQDAQTALAASAHDTFTWSGGRNASERSRATNQALYLKLANSTNNETWQLDRIDAVLRETGRARQRQFN